MRNEELQRFVLDHCPEMAAYFSIDCKWHELVYMLRPFLVEANGWYAFAHEAIAEAVHARYKLSDPAVCIPIRLKLARLFLSRFFEMFDSKGATHLLHRCISEFAHHMTHLEKTPREFWPLLVDEEEEVCASDDIPLSSYLVSNIIRLLGVMEKLPPWLQGEAQYVLSTSKVVESHRRTMAKFSAKSSEVRGLFKSRSLGSTGSMGGGGGGIGGGVGSGFAPPSARQALGRRSRSMDHRGMSRDDAAAPGAGPGAKQRKMVRFDLPLAPPPREELEPVPEVSEEVGGGGGVNF
jgi:hypothetical protein